MAVDISRISKLVEIVLAEHAHCDRRCLNDNELEGRQMDPDHHRKYMAKIIGYFAIGLDADHGF